jgi:hypothetical protein
MSLVSRLTQQYADHPHEPVLVRLTITPEMAAEFLKHNVTNRPLRPGQVDKYAFDMQSGEWALTHQSIAFNSRHELIDGQHRLNAIVKVGRPIPMHVTFNVEAGYGDPIDRGLSRSLSDVTRESRRATSTATVLVPMACGQRAPVTHVTVRRVLTMYRTSMDWAMKHVPQRTGMTAHVLAAFVYAHAVESASVETFVDRLRDRDGGGGSPVGALMKLL